MTWLWVHRFFFLLGHVCYWCSLLHFSFNSLNSSALAFLFLMMSFSVELLFCVLFSWFWSLSLILVLSVFSCSMSFFKTIILKSLSGNHRFPFLWGHLLENCSFFGDVIFPLFFIFLVALCWCLCIWLSSYLYQTLPTGFSGERPFTCSGFKGVGRVGMMVPALGEAHQLHKQRSVSVKLLGSSAASALGICSSSEGFWVLWWQRLLETSWSLSLPWDISLPKGSLLALDLALEYPCRGSEHVAWACSDQL